MYPLLTNTEVQWYLHNDHFVYPTIYTQQPQNNNTYMAINNVIIGSYLQYMCVCVCVCVYICNQNILLYTWN